MSQNKDRHLTENIRIITRLDLDFPHAGFYTPAMRVLSQDMAFVRIHRLSRFWKQQEGEEHTPLTQGIEDLITGLYGQRSSWMFVLKGTPKEIICFFGVSRKFMDIPSLTSTLCGAFPDIRVAAVPVPDRSLFDSLTYSLILTGIPGHKRKQGHLETNSDQIERVCRGLYGTHWMYVVYAVPIEPTVTINDLYQLTTEIRRTRTAYMLKNSPTGEQDRLAQRYVDLLEAQLKRFEQGRITGMWHTQTALFTDDASVAGRARSLLRSAFSGETSMPEPVRVSLCNSGIARNANDAFTTALTSQEAALLARPPHEEYPGYEVVDYARFGVIGGIPSESSPSVHIGHILDRGVETGNSLNMPLQDFSKHGLIVGVTGSGKTNTCFALLEQLWEQNIPFLVIESAKSEYRALLQNSKFSNLNVFTVGDETIAPLRLNPFEVPEGGLVQTHVDYLKSLFSAAFVLYPPMPYVLEQSLQEVYEDRGWNLATNTNRRGKHSERLFPTLSDLIAKIETVTQRLQYDAQITMNIRAGLLARLNMLRIGGGKGRMLNTRRSIPPHVLFETPCVLELKSIVSDDEKAFFIGLILIRLYEYCELNIKATGQLRHVTLIEEAHRLLRNVSTEQGSDVVANPKGRAIEVFANILSEIRAYGEGILIAEQIPTKLTPDAIKNTNLKILHRLVAEDDRKTVGNTMNLTDSQFRYVTTLERGEAAVYTEGIRKPVLLQVPQKKSDETLADQTVKEQADSLRKVHVQLFMTFKGCEHCPFGWTTCAYSSLIHDLSDVLLKEAFIRLFNALRLNSTSILETYTEFQERSRPLSAQNVQPPSLYCLFIEFVDTEIEQRGKFGGWAYKHLENAIRLSCSIISCITKQEGKIEADKVKDLYATDLTELRELFQQLHAVKVFPYPGCRFCEQPCAYRFDMASFNQSIYAEEFFDALSEEQPDPTAIIEICRKAVARYFHEENELVRDEAAFCFAVQQLSTRQLSRTKQEELAAFLRSRFQHGGH